MEKCGRQSYEPLFQARKYNRDVTRRRESFVSRRNTEEKSISDERSLDSTFLISLEHVYVHVPREISGKVCERRKDRQTERWWCTEAKGLRTRYATVCNDKRGDSCEEKEVKKYCGL